MKIQNGVFIVLLITGLQIPGVSENPCGIMFPKQDTTTWGLGFIRIPINKGVTLNILTVEGNHTWSIREGMVQLPGDSSVTIAPEDYIYYCDYFHLNLKVYEKRKGRYKILVNTIKGGAWIASAELGSTGLTFSTYAGFISRKKNHSIPEEGYKPSHVRMGVNLLNSCLNVRDTPAADGNVIKCIRCNTQDVSAGHVNIEVLQVREGWAEVKISEFGPFIPNEEDLECNFKLLGEFTGYVKVADSNGRPYIWYEHSAY